MSGKPGIKVSRVIDDPFADLDEDGAAATHPKLVEGGLCRGRDIRLLEVYRASCGTCRAVGLVHSMLGSPVTTGKQQRLPVTAETMPEGAAFRLPAILIICQKSISRNALTVSTYPPRHIDANGGRGGLLFELTLTEGKNAVHNCLVT
jgi:hypothetical protein